MDLTQVCLERVYISSGEALRALPGALNQTIGDVLSFNVTIIWSVGASMLYFKLEMNVKLNY